MRAQRRQPERARRIAIDRDDRGWRLAEAGLTQTTVLAGTAAHRPGSPGGAGPRLEVFDSRGVRVSVHPLPMIDEIRVDGGGPDHEPVTFRQEGPVRRTVNVPLLRDGGYLTFHPPGVPGASAPPSPQRLPLAPIQGDA